MTDVVVDLAVPVPDRTWKDDENECRMPDLSFNGD